MARPWLQGCDTHVHVFDPARFPYAPDRRYTPAAATVDALCEHLARLGLGRAVLVAASVYGADNRCLTAALAELGPARARGVASLGDEVLPAEVEALDRAGVRGARLNLEVGRERDPQVARALLKALAVRIPPHWRICLYGSLHLVVALRAEIEALANAPVIEHFGMARIADGGVAAPGFRDLLAILETTGSFIKFSGPYQISGSGPGYADVAPVARSLAAAAPGRVLWGSNWPHTAGAARTASVDLGRVEPFRQEDDARNLRLLAEWLGHTAARSALFDAATAAFGFDAP